MRALVIVDVQNDFCHGSLATERGDEIAALIGAFQHSEQLQDNGYARIVATADNHIDPGAHFSKNPDFVDSWPAHCVAGTEGTQFHDEIDAQQFDAVFTKGEYSAAYSGFEGSFKDQSLADWLRSQDITHLDVCGIATDHCVRATVLDGLKEGFDVRVLTGLVAAVDNARGDEALAEMEAAGAELL